MTLVAEFATDSETFVVGRALAGTEGLTIELERVIPTGESVVPYYWVWGDDLETYEDNLASEPGVEDVDAIARTDEGALYRIEGNGETSMAIYGLFDVDLTLLGGTCTVDGWEFQIRFQSSDAANAFKTHLDEQAIPHTLERVYQLTNAPGDPEGRLTAQQREALLVAYQSGYFEEPRETCLRELADRLGISPSSAAGRLRRGHAALIEHHIASNAAGWTGQPVHPAADSV
jgi:predicted DNA binding protein